MCDQIMRNETGGQVYVEKLDERGLGADIEKMAKLSLCPTNFKHYPMKANGGVDA